MNTINKTRGRDRGPSLMCPTNIYREIKAASNPHAMPIYKTIKVASNKTSIANALDKPREF